MLGIWKNYDELEELMSLPELIATINAHRERLYDDRKFAASLKGINLDESSKGSGNEWEDLKARVFSGGKAQDAKDILAFSGKNAQIKGFGIGNGLDYAEGDSVQWWG